MDTFDIWLAGGERVAFTSEDLRAADTILRRFDLPLRAPDAIHLSIASRIGATLATFDSQMAACAVALGVAVADVEQGRH